MDYFMHEKKLMDLNNSQVELIQKWKEAYLEVSEKNRLMDQYINKLEDDIFRLQDFLLKERMNSLSQD